MSTLATVDIDGTDVTGDVLDRSCSVRMKSADLTLVGSAFVPTVGDLVTITDPDWLGIVNSVESTGYRGNVPFIKIRATNEVELTDLGAAPYNLSDTPNGTTTFGFDVLVITRTRAEGGWIETRCKCTVFEEGLYPGQEIAITSVVEGFTAEVFTIMDVQTEWPVEDGAKYILDLGLGTFEEATTGGPDAGGEGDPLDPVTLEDTIRDMGCEDCPPSPPFTEGDQDDVSGLLCEGVYPYTPAGTYDGIGPPILSGGNWSYESTTFIHYWSSGGMASDYPLAGQGGHWGNGGVNNCVYTSGGVDYGAGGLNRYITITPIGPGTLSVITAAAVGACSNGGGIDMTAVQNATSDVVDTDTGVPGDTLTVVIPDDPGGCGHHVLLTGVPGNGEFGFVSATWVPAAVATPDDKQPVLETVTGDGTSTSFTTTLGAAYWPDSLYVEVNGLDWTATITETDPTAGEYDLDYPFPLDSTVKIRYQAKT